MIAVKLERHEAEALIAAAHAAAKRDEKDALTLAGLDLLDAVGKLEAAMRLPLLIAR